MRLRDVAKNTCSARPHGAEACPRIFSRVAAAAGISALVGFLVGCDALVKQSQPEGKAVQFDGVRSLAPNGNGTWTLSWPAFDFSSEQKNYAVFSLESTDRKNLGAISKSWSFKSEF